MLRFRQKPLPEIAEKFLIAYGVGKSKNTVNLYRGSLHHFYRFLSQFKLDLARLELKHIDEYDEDLERHNLKFITRKENIKHVHKYLRWLEYDEVLQAGFTKKLFPKYRGELVRGKRVELPELAIRCLEVLSATNKISTVKGYQTCLRTFYKDHWLTGKPAYKIDRVDIDNFQISLKNNSTSVSTRSSRLANLRRYFDWLYDHKKLKIHPDRLIKSNDFPRRDKMLPKPFPVDVDMEIQKRLSVSNEIDWMGVLLTDNLF